MLTAVSALARLKICEACSSGDAGVRSEKTAARSTPSRPRLRTPRTGTARARSSSACFEAYTNAEPGSYLLDLRCGLICNASRQIAARIVWLAAARARIELSPDYDADVVFPQCLEVWRADPQATPAAAVDASELAEKPAEDAGESMGDGTSSGQSAHVSQPKLAALMTSLRGQHTSKL